MLESQRYFKETLCTYQFCLSNRLITQIHGDDDPDGNLVKEFIKKQFFIKYKAEINSLMPNIVSLVNKNGDIRAAVGYRSADKKLLYLEQYLSLPIDRLLSEKEGHDITRDQIVEVGNLACLSHGYARVVIIKLTQMLHSAGYQWVVFTLTKELLNSFRKLDLSPQYLEIAKNEKINTGDYWGSYYETSPAVMYGNIEKGLNQLMR